MIQFRSRQAVRNTYPRRQSYLSETRIDKGSFRGGKLIIWRARESSAQASHEVADAGTILDIDADAGTVACAGSTALRIEEIQVEGKRRMSAREFVNGARLKVGHRISQE